MLPVECQLYQEWATATIEKFRHEHKTPLRFYKALRQEGVLHHIVHMFDAPQKGFWGMWYGGSGYRCIKCEACFGSIAEAIEKHGRIKLHKLDVIHKSYGENKDYGTCTITSATAKGKWSEVNVKKPW